MTLGGSRALLSKAMESRQQQQLQLFNNVSKLTFNIPDSKSNGTNKAKKLMERLNLDKLLKYGPTTPLISPGSNHHHSPHHQTLSGFTSTGNTLFDIASLMLFGTHALPIRLKILLDRLLCALEHDEFVNLLHAFGWTYEDYSRGYMLQDSIGNILTKWIIVSKEEEIYIIQLFLKFPETKAIAQNFVMNETASQFAGQFNPASSAIAAAAAAAASLAGNAVAGAGQNHNNQCNAIATIAQKFKDYELKKLADCTNSNLITDSILVGKNQPSNNSKSNSVSSANRSSSHASDSAVNNITNNINNSSNKRPRSVENKQNQKANHQFEFSIENFVKSKNSKQSINIEDNELISKQSISKQSSSSSNNINPLNISSSTLKSSDRLSKNHHQQQLHRSNLNDSIGPFDFHKKTSEPINHLPRTTTELSQFMPSNIIPITSTSKTSPTTSISSIAVAPNPLFSLANPLTNFNNLLNPATAAALLSDPNKYPNAVSDYFKVDLTNPATAAAFAHQKNLDFGLSFTANNDSSKMTSLSSPPTATTPSSLTSSNQTKKSDRNERKQNSKTTDQQASLTSSAINLSSSNKSPPSNHRSSGSNQNESSYHSHHRHHNHHGKNKQNKHLRKSNNPTKRRWDPLILSSLTTNPATGKKRVQCSVCLKTFCDKGALKIHFSAVHLREMHKCTVEGCNMMFSSRRSRNRHSANPNPKLHTPNFRRKINPHDGRTANPYPMIPPPPGTIFGIPGMNGGVITNLDPLKTSFSSSDHSDKTDFAIDFNSINRSGSLSPSQMRSPHKSPSPSSSPKSSLRKSLDESLSRKNQNILAN
ncbi:forkhead domain-containing protein [Sarcoptes scabiei]|nr:forkhead domain-containing protein [Sarcoptes scabiei]